MYESASGYALFERTGGEEIAERSIEVQTQLQDFKNFSKNIHLRSFTPFSSSENALQNINDVSEGTRLCGRATQFILQFWPLIELPVRPNARNKVNKNKRHMEKE